VLTTSATSKIVQDIQKSDVTNSDNQKCLSYLPYSFTYTTFTFKDGQVTYNEPVTTTTAFTNTTSIMDMLMSGLGNSTSSQSEICKVSAEMLGGSDLPSGISIYPVDFDLKDNITQYLDAWNAMCENGESYTYTNQDGTSVTVRLAEKDKITYTDTVGIIINMINTMIQMITIALVAFTALSLVVSTVMIGIITYVSVVERVKEIGILRAVGARKKDIKRLFNAETFIIGLVAGAIGIAVTYLLSLIINIIVLMLAGIWGIAALPWWQALIMVALSVVLTLISGLIPASAAAKKDPVVALRTE
jgi:putative ABC transport system permease protein